MDAYRHRQPNPYKRLDAPGESFLPQVQAKDIKPPPVFDQLGVVKAGAFADLLLAEGNPLENIKLIEDPDNNFAVIMQGGTIVKNILKPG